MSEILHDIEFRDVSKHYGSVCAVDGVSFSVRRGSFHSFLGGSGCGKTTSLRMIAGFEQPTRGSVLVGGRDMAGVPAHQRPVNMVFQSYALFPHLSVLDNVAYGLRYRQPRPERAQERRMAEQALEMVRLSGFGQRKPHELSGGQQQRVALARALVNQPTVLLLDEPLSALDRKLRKEMQSELLRLQREVGITFVLVTHDQEEALSMSDSISVMQNGRILQNASPQELYEQPANRFIADFIGEANLIDGHIDRRDGTQIVLRTEAGLELAARCGQHAGELNPGCAASIAVRPEQVSISAANCQAERPFCLTGQVVDRIFLGHQIEYRVQTQALGVICARVPQTEGGAFGHGCAVRVAWDPVHSLALGA
ncbi:spermidine/putrescine ABC transporter ATP-binding protein [Pseudomonas sp. HAR-UPW-AIA-41]|uniref:ABC transporter ATP-binding protein n=1 Tax=Pseudomonas sp. HAR-UPW-AIA-41 TaxID=1985301 RepID=UPI000BB33A85|nr:ABC transporter ATP-binding protein [Pseudomonas sp. HAR-UPW-AIA-41]PAV48209.1 spermidine/putrescine ABC transporter ATP-binding protein [Pseudomonas sp. HAR-UPW-AIA-41]